MFVLIIYLHSCMKICYARREIARRVYEVEEGARDNSVFIEISLCF